jgi:hypothetical protein
MTPLFFAKHAIRSSGIHSYHGTTQCSHTVIVAKEVSRRSYTANRVARATRAHEFTYG